MLGSYSEYCGSEQKYGRQQNKNIIVKNKSTSQLIHWREGSNFHIKFNV